MTALLDAYKELQAEFNTPCVVKKIDKSKSVITLI